MNTNDQTLENCCPVDLSLSKKYLINAHFYFGSNRSHFKASYWGFAPRILQVMFSRTFGPCLAKCLQPTQDLTFCLPKFIITFAAICSSTKALVTPHAPRTLRTIFAPEEFFEHSIRSVFLQFHLEIHRKMAGSKWKGDHRHTGSKYVLALFHLSA